MKFFTPAEDQFLRQNFKRLNNKQLSRQMARSESSIAQRMRKLKLQRSAALRWKMQAANFFKPGHVPFNKDRKGIRVSPATEFKKGHLPANTKFDGCISTRYHKKHGCYYKYIRVAKMKWMLLNRYLWEKHHGPIPANHLVAFKDGNNLNCSLENLFLLSRAANARRNVNYKKTSAAMKRYWKDGHHLKSDHYIAMTAAGYNRQLAEQIEKNPQLLGLQRLRLKLRRQIHDTKNA